MGHSSKQVRTARKKIAAGERVLLVLVDHRADSKIVHKAVYYAGLHARARKQRMALLYVKEPMGMQLFGVSDVIKQESKEESIVQLTNVENQIGEWFGAKQEVACYIREGEVSETISDFITKNRFVSGLVLTSWQFNNMVSGLQNYIAGAKKMKSARQVPVIIVPEDATLAQIDEIYG